MSCACIYCTYVILHEQLPPSVAHKQRIEESQKVIDSMVEILNNAVTNNEGVKE